MPCECEQISCLECAPPCSTPSEPIVEACETPTYTSNGCLAGQHTNCVLIDNTTDACIPITNGSNLTTALNNIKAYIKGTFNRLTALNNSITIIPTDDACDDKATIGVNLSEDANNALELRANGLFVPEAAEDTGLLSVSILDSTSVNLSGDGNTGTPLSAVVIRDTITNGGNNILTVGANGIYVPPTVIPSAQGFAVTGNTRTSQYGAMQFFATLALANASAVAGETVLIYNDTIEDLQIKNNVNYVGVGVHSIGDLTGTPGSTSYLANLIIASVSLNGTYTITTEGVTVIGQADFLGATKWQGGRFIGQNDSVMVSQQCELSHIYCSTYLELAGNATVTHSRIEDTKIELGGYYAVSVNNTSGGFEVDAKCTFSNNYVSSINNQAAYVITRTTQNCSVVTNNTFKSIAKTALFVHSGGVNETTIGFVANNNISNVGSEPAVILYDIAAALNILRDSTPFFVNNNVYSKTGIGVKSISTGLKSCNILSTDNYGLLISNEEEDSYNVNIVDCTVESKNNKALFAEDNIYIVGGTFTSRLNTSAGNPIYIDMDTSSRNFYIAGVKTIARNTSAYAIENGTTALTVKVANCTFLNENTAGPVLGIHDTLSGGNITLTAVTIDAYGNIR